MFIYLCKKCPFLSSLRIVHVRFRPEHKKKKKQQTLESLYALFRHENKQTEFKKFSSCCQFLSESFKCLKSWPGTQHLKMGLEF